MRYGPIIVCDDDTDDLGFFKLAFKKLGKQHEVITFESTIDVKDYLKNTTDRPFLIFCDINMPLQNGVEFKKEIDECEELSVKNVPFIFYSTSGNRDMVKRVYAQSVIQGYFVKPLDVNEISGILKIIIDYWETCRHPNSNAW